MKYVVLPIFDYLLIPIIKFLWAIILTVGYTPVLLIHGIVLLIWNLKLKDEDFECCMKEYRSISPYWGYFDDIQFLLYEKTETHIFVTYYHYIWGITY